MFQLSGFALLAARFQPGWDDVIVGYDFGLLRPAEIQAWILARGEAGPACAALTALTGEMPAEFEALLWKAGAEATGKAPRPGATRWSLAQDRWRVALLQDALALAEGEAALASRVEDIYETVGCPEDMLGLWRRNPGLRGGPAHADRDAVQTFIRRRELALGA